MVKVSYAKGGLDGGIVQKEDKISTGLFGKKYKLIICKYRVRHGLENGNSSFSNKYYLEPTGPVQK